MAQLAIPSAPRAVRLGQVRAAWRRLALVCLAAAGGLALVGAVAFWASSRLARERAFEAEAAPVTGVVASVDLPPLDERDHGTARLRVIYRFLDRDYSASDVELPALEAEGLGKGAKVHLLVDPAHPDRPREAGAVSAARPVRWVTTLAVGVGALVALALVVAELRRAARRELAPLRTGAIVWLTPQGAWPEASAGQEVVFPATYLREGVVMKVRARAAPGPWVRQGEKVLAAVVPAEPTWTRVIDERLARALGWYRG